MSRKINYEDAIENLQKMFAGVDKEVINTILTMHKGRLDPTIEDLLKLTNDAVDDDNIFDDGSNKKSYEPALGFEDEDDRARQTQEEKDMELALKLQEQEIRDSKRSDQNYRAQQQSRGYGQSQQQQQPRGYGQPQQLFPQQSQDRFQQQYQYQPDQQRQQRPQPYQPQSQPQNQQSNSSPVKEEKKKKKFSEKLKDAKIKFFSFFKKGKKKGKEGVGNNKAGTYAEIDNLDDIGNIDAGVGGMRLDDDLDDIPDIEANPYSGKPIPKKDPSQPVKKNQRDASPNSEEEDSDDFEDRGINEEAKANFKFEPEMQYRKPDFDDVRGKNGAAYPKFEDDHDSDLKEYYNNKKIADQGEGLDLV